MKHVNRISSVKLGRWWNFFIKFFVPIVLTVIVIGDVYNEIKTPYEGYSWSALMVIGLGWVIATLLAAVMISTRPWRNSIN